MTPRDRFCACNPRCSWARSSSSSTAWPRWPAGVEALGRSTRRGVGHDAALIHARSLLARGGRLIVFRPGGLGLAWHPRLADRRKTEGPHRVGIESAAPRKFIGGLIVKQRFRRPLAGYAVGRATVEALAREHALRLSEHARLHEGRRTGVRSSVKDGTSTAVTRGAISHRSVRCGGIRIGPARRRLRGVSA